MEDKNEHLDFGKFWDSLDDDDEEEYIGSSSTLIEQKPLLPKNQYSTRSMHPQNGRKTQSMKIERKTPLDAMVRRNHQMKKQANKMPTYNDLQRQPSIKSKFNVAQKPRIQPTIQQQQHRIQQDEKHKTYQNENHSLYPRYTPHQPKPKSNPLQKENNNYLRAQMLKELRSQQERKPINLNKEHLQPPQIRIPPKTISRYPPTVSSPTQTFTHNTPKKYRSPYYQQSEPEPEIIDDSQLIACIQNIQDQTKIDVLLKMLDGQWHSDAELIRIAKKTRDFIGVVGFGMLMCSFEDTVAKSFLIKKINPGNTSQFKINDNFIELARAAYSQYKKSE